MAAINQRKKKLIAHAIASLKTKTSNHQNTHSAIKASFQPVQLKALTAAALTLPGLLQSPAMAADEEVSFSYGHYQEGERKLFGAQSAFSPIEVESVQGSGKWKLTDRIKFAFNYQQDTWGGATPIATAPLGSGGNSGFNGTPGSQNTIGGATPRTNPDGTAYFDNQSNIYRGVTNTQSGVTTFSRDKFVHTLSEASPEVRKQGDFKLSYEWDDAAVDVGGGISLEDDYESRFGSLNTRWDFNQKQTTLNVGLSYTNSDTNATIDHDFTGYYSADEDYDPIQRGVGSTGKNILTGKKQDWSASLGLTQVLNKSAMIEAGLSFTRSTGYMENPYKAVSIAFIDPLAQDSCAGTIQGLQCGTIGALFEQRPDERNQWAGNLRFIQHIAPLDAALHASYRIFSDDWGITSHTFDADWVQPLGQGWSVTPRIRYYSQDQADFYTPLLTTNQGSTNNVIDPVRGPVFVDLNNPNSPNYYDDINFQFVPDGDLIGIGPFGNALLDEKGRPLSQAEIDNLSGLGNKTTPFDRNKLPKNFSSDHRLSGYGALSGGVTVTKQFAKGIALDLGFEYYTHQGSLKIGGGGEGSFADFDYWTANAALRVDLAALSYNGSSIEHAHHNHHSHGAHAPAGVMFDHMLPKAGDMMAGYRYMYSGQSGTMLNGDRAVNDATLIANGCGGNPCYLTSSSMAMHMHMLDLMYAPTDWLTLMLMPQFMDMDMEMRDLEGGSQRITNDQGNITGGNSNLGQHVTHHLQNGHETGGIGDLGMYALFKLFDDGIHHVHITTGFSAPTANVDIKLRRNHKIDGGFIHYGMQLGSGTWDFKPSVTYTGHLNDWSWGAQANGTVRMESQNESGYRLGDMFQATAWGNYAMTNWLTASVRGVYTVQGGIAGQFTGSNSDSDNPFINSDGSFTNTLKFGPMDYADSYGGKYWDVGFGLSATVPSGSLAGNRISVEYLHPVSDDVNGYQLERDGSLSATWSKAF
ncbi:MAG: DUF3570 domain-containing protein [Methylococcaceae bacterium]|nr:DUF3570 domain-containing protein [Methylococcaceae bacterium]